MKCILLYILNLLILMILLFFFIDYASERNEVCFQIAERN